MNSSVSNNHSHYNSSLSQRCSTCAGSGTDGGNHHPHHHHHPLGISGTCCGHHSSTNSTTTTIKYIYDLPYHVRKSLCDLIDADGSWRQLGGQYMNINDTHLTLISHAILRGGSPTNDLLIRWEQTNGQVRHLFKYLYAMRHKRAMLILSPYVDGKLRALCKETTEEDEDAAVGEDGCSVSLIGGKACGGRDDIVGYPGSDKQAILGAVGYNYNKSKSVVAMAPMASQSSEKKILNQQCCWNDLSVGGGQAGREDNDHINLVGRREKYSDKSISCTPSECSTLVQTSLEEDLEVPYKELLLSTDDFNEDRIIGSGGFGIVYKGIWKGTEVAIKRLKSCDSMHQAKIELRALNQYRIDNILPLYGISLDGPEACLLYQYMPNGSLEDRILCKKNQPPLTWQQRATIGEGLAKALNFLHTLRGKPMVHGDVKSANILLDAQFQCKLGDFGLARQIMSSTSKGLYTHLTVTSVHGTCVYLPPEYLRNKILSPAVDVYSYGIVMLEMATGRRAYDGKKLLLELVQEEMTAGTRDESRKGAIRLRDTRMGLAVEGTNWFSNLIQLGLDCAAKQKNKRPGMVQVLEYFAQCRTRDRIRRLSAESANNGLTGINHDEIKTPLELQLWYDMTKKTNDEGHPPVEVASTACPTFGSSVDRSIASSETQTCSSMGDNDSRISDVLNNPDLMPMMMDDSGEGIIPLITELGLNDDDEVAVVTKSDNESCQDSETSGMNIDKLIG